MAKKWSAIMNAVQSVFFGSRSDMLRLFSFEAIRFFTTERVKKTGGIRIMKKLIAALLCLMCVFSFALAESFKVGMECDYAPFNWTQAEPSEYAVPISGGGYADGYDVQIAKRIAEGLGLELTIVKTEWDGLPMGVMSGKLDAIIAGMSPTSERKLSIDFSDRYYTSDLVIVVRKDSAYANAKSLADFSGAKITGQLNTFHYTVIDQIPGVKKMTAMDTFPAMIVALNAGSIDGYISERPGAVSAQVANPNLTYIAFDEGSGFATENPDDTAIAVGLKKGSDELREKINAILAQIPQEEREQIMKDAVSRQPVNN